MREALNGSLVDVAVCSGPADAAAALEDGSFDFALLDYDAAQPGAAELTRKLKSAAPRTAVVVFMDRAQPLEVLAALGAGVSAVFVKRDVRSEALGDALELIGRDGALFVGATPARAIREFVDRRSVRSTQLTSRELDVLEQISVGATNAAIAEQLGVTDNAVKHHVRNIIRKLGVSTRGAAAHAARERGLIKSGSAD